MNSPRRIQADLSTMFQQINQVTYQLVLTIKRAPIFSQIEVSFSDTFNIALQMEYIIITLEDIFWFCENSKIAANTISTNFSTRN